MEYGVLGAPGDGLDSGVGEARGQAAAGDVAEDVVVGESRAEDAPADEFGREVADDGFDFGEFWHFTRLGACAPSRWLFLRPAAVGPAFP